MQIQELTGIPAATLQNGDGMKELGIKLQIAELTLSKAGITIDQDTIAKEVITWADKVLLQRLSKEEKQQYQNAIESIKQKLAETNEKYGEQISFLKETLKDEIRKKENIQKQLDEIQAEQKFTPSIRGGNTEEDLARRIRSIAPYDDLSLKQRHQGSTDILTKVKLSSEQKSVVGKICVESKDVDKWKDDFVQEAKEHGKKEDTQNIILATTVMPPDAINSNLDCFRDDVWIVPIERLEFAYAAFRKILIERHNLQKGFDSQMETIKSEKEVVEQLKDIVTTEAFKKYSEIAGDLLKQADKLEEESRTMINYVETKNSRFQNVAETVRNLVNCMIEHSDDIQKKIKGSFGSAAVNN